MAFDKVSSQLPYGSETLKYIWVGDKINSSLYAVSKGIVAITDQTAATLLTNPDNLIKIR